MADGIQISAGSGTLVGADLCTVNAIANTYVQLVKVGFGVNDSFAYVTSAAGLPVAQQGAWTVALSGAVPAGTNVIGHVIVDTAPTTAVTGTFWQATQPVSLATAPTTPVTGTFWQATQPVSLASLPALAAGSAVIGHVVVDTAPTTTVNGTVTANAGTGTMAVSLASAPLPSGAATAANQATANTSLASLDVALSTRLKPADTLAGITTVATVSAVTAITNALPAGTNTIGAVNAIQAGDVLEIAGTTYTVLKAFANATASGNTQIVALTGGKKIRVLKYTISASAAVNVYFNSSTAGAISSTKYLAGAGGGVGAGLCNFGHFDTTTGEALQINLSTTANVGVDILYILV